MNKTEKILACIGHIDFKEIHKVVGCTHSLVYSVAYSRGVTRKKGRVSLKPKPLQVTTPFKKEMNVMINESDAIWEITFVGNQAISLRDGRNRKSVTKDKVCKIIEDYE